MYCLNIIFLFIIAVNSKNSYYQYLSDYFKSATYEKFNKICAGMTDWNGVVAKLLQETVGKDIKYALNNKDDGLRLSTGYSHEHGPVQVIFTNFDLMEFPQLISPEIEMHLDANMVKIRANLTRMRITASYKLLRNLSDVIDNVEMQDPYKRSPFLFKPVHDSGNIGLIAEGCRIYGYVIARLSLKSIQLGHHSFNLTRCVYTVEIYQLGDMSPPIIAPYSPNSHMDFALPTLSKLIGEEIVVKLQEILSFSIQTPKIFGENLNIIREKQTEVFKKTLTNLSNAVRYLNHKIWLKHVVFDDFFISWNEATMKPVDDKHLQAEADNYNASLKLVNMSLTGLDTAFFSHTGGPFMWEEVMIGGMIRFSSLQVKGLVQYPELKDPFYPFSVEYIDYDVDITIEALNSHPYYVLQPMSARKVEVTQPSIQWGAIEAVVNSHLINMITKAIKEDYLNEFPSILLGKIETKLEGNVDVI